MTRPIAVVNNAWLEYLLGVKHLQAYGVFLFVIAHHSAGDCQKRRRLDKIFQERPEIACEINNSDILRAFKELDFCLAEHNKSLSVAELQWVKKYLVNDRNREAVLKEIEWIIYRRLLLHSRFDNVRRNFRWTALAKGDMANIASECLLESAPIKPKRKLEIAKEFGFDTENHARNYFYILLRDGHLDKAAAVKTTDPYLAYRVAEQKIMEGEIDDAIAILKRFYPEWTEILEEAQKIKAAMAAV